MIDESDEDLVRRAFLEEPIGDLDQRRLDQSPELQARLVSLRSLVERLDGECAEHQESDLLAIMEGDPDPGEQAASDAMLALMQARPEVSWGRRLSLWAGGLAAAAILLMVGLHESQDALVDPGTIDPGGRGMVLLGNEDFSSFAPVGDSRLPLVFEFEYTGESSSMAEYGIVVRGLPELDPTFELESQLSKSPTWTPTDLELSQLPETFMWLPVVYEDGEYEEGPATRVRLLRD